MSVGGPLLEVSANGRLFAVAGDSDSTRKLGGYTSEYEPNGNNTARKIMTPSTWSYEGVSLEIDDDRGDLEFLQAISDSPEDVAFVFTEISGISYEGVGSVTGDIARSSQNATAPLNFMGPGKLRRQ